MLLAGWDTATDAEPATPTAGAAATARRELDAGAVGKGGASLATGKFPEATQVVDLFHAREHLHDLARQLEFMLSDRKDEWLAARLKDLDHGDIDAICREARVFPLEGIKKDELGTALGYFENNAHRMRY